MKNPKVAVFDIHKFEKPVFEKINSDYGNQLVLFESKLNLISAPSVKGFDVVCSFVNDQIDRPTLEILRENGVKLIALRSAGFNHVDLTAAREVSIKVVRVPAYSPHAVAEHAVALILCLNRKIHRANSRTHELNFSLDGLVGFDLNGKTVGVVGTGKIGKVFAKIMAGFGCKVLAYDVSPDSELPVEYVSLNELLQRSNIISLHVPLSPSTKHLIDKDALSKMGGGTMLINTGRGALIDTKALIDSLKSGRVGFAGLDVYEEEENIFFQDKSDGVLQDDLLARLLTFPNVIVTSHQGFLTREALENIVHTTFENILSYFKGSALENEVEVNDGKAK
jgi:D-lactate dehydrogenase